MNRVIRMTLLLIFRPKHFKNNIFFFFLYSNSSNTIVGHLLSLIFICIIQSFRKDFCKSLQHFEYDAFGSVLFSSTILGSADNKQKIIRKRKQKKANCDFLFSLFQYLIEKCKKSIKEFQRFLFARDYKFNIYFFSIVFATYRK